MAFKPGQGFVASRGLPGGKPRGQEETKKLSELRPILNQTKTQQTNNPLYQYLNSLLSHATDILNNILARLADLENTKSNSNNSTNTTGLDYVVMSDGAIPTPSPVNDGFGNFIYIPYEP